MKKAALFILLAVFTVLAVACGGDAAPPEPEKVTLNISGYDEFRFDPDSVSVKPGAEVTLNFSNEGALEHNWLLISSSADAATATDVDALSGINAGFVPGGESTSYTFVAPGPGSYQMVCTVAGHAAGGMVGEFVVEAGE